MADDREKYCLIGAGSSGLVAAKTFLESGIDFDCYEREDDVGGNWYYGRPHSSVYQSTHLISSKPLTEYTDFPMPADYPDYPHHPQVWEYLRSYARHFGLYQHIQFNCGVQRVEPLEQGRYWQVTLDSSRQRIYRGLVIANGHNWDPKWPDYPGRFDGLVLHSARYKTPDVLAGRRVLVVGGGNSGCDIAVESAQHAAATFHSLRRGYHYLPKFFRGLPIDQCGERLLRWRLPLWLRRAVSTLAIRWVLGRPERFGLPRPDHRLFETHPIVNSQLIYYAGHGRIRVKPDVAALSGGSVRFVDGTVEPIDVIIYATGFRLSFPFMDAAHLNWHDGRPHLFLNVFHPRYDNLFVIGLIQPDSGQFGLADYQSQLVARFIAARKSDHPSARAFWRLATRSQADLSSGIRYVASSRHLLEVEHFGYRRRLQRLIARLPDPLPRPAAP